MKTSLSASLLLIAALVPITWAREMQDRNGRSLLQTTTYPDAHPWGKLLSYSFMFYEAQQSGVLPDWNRVSEKAGGYRGDSHVNDGSDIGVDVSGGFHDAGDHVKYHVPMTQAFSTMGLGALVHEQGYRASGQWDYMARIMKHATDYLVKAHLVNSKTPTANVMVTQVGDTSTDHAYWGRPEQQTGKRPTATTKKAPAADVMGNTAAVFASASMIFSKGGKYKNTTYAADLLDRARNLLAAGDAMPGTWWDDAYKSSNYKDEMALGYLMVCKADLRAKPTTLPQTCVTGMQRYIAAYRDLNNTVNWDWDSQMFSSSALLTNLAADIQKANAGAMPAEVAVASGYMTKTLANWQDKTQQCGTTALGAGHWGVCYTAGGLAYLTVWGALRHASNAAFAASVHAATLGAAGNTAAARQHRCWARSQLSYAAGTNPAKQSYIVGYVPNGLKGADRPHHRAASCNANYNLACDWAEYSFDGPSPNVLIGALVGGPDSTDVFDNNRQDYVMNEVTLDYNAGFTGLLAGTYLTTARLAQANCTWDNYCAGKCDSAAEGTSRPKRVAEVPYTTPTISSGLSPLQTCLVNVPTVTKQYACNDCMRSTISDAIRPLCLACPPKAAVKGNEWACVSICASMGTVTDVAACNQCILGSDPGTCQQCPAAAAALSTSLGGKDTTAQKMGCFNCVANVSQNGWACSGCLKKSTQAQVDACLACVVSNPAGAGNC